MNLRKKTALIVCGTSPLGVDLVKGFTLSGATVTATARASGRVALEALETAASIVDLDLENPLSIDACVYQLTSGKKFDFVVFVCGHLLAPSWPQPVRKSPSWQLLCFLRHACYIRCCMLPTQATLRSIVVAIDLFSCLYMFVLAANA